MINGIQQTLLGVSLFEVNSFFILFSVQENIPKFLSKVTHALQMLPIVEKLWSIPLSLKQLSF